jgi:ankyrin repeat protein
MIQNKQINEIKFFIQNTDNKIWECKEENNLNVLHKACFLNFDEVIITIINETKSRLNSNKAEFEKFINEREETEGFTPLHYSSFRGNIKICSILIENGANLNKLSIHNYNMIHMAAKGNQPGTIVLFKEKYLQNIEALDDKGCTPLHFAVQFGSENAVVFLLTFGANPNYKDNKGYTPLHYGVMYNRVKIVKKLLQRGANKNLREYEKNLTPVEMAQKKNLTELIEVFRKKNICEILFLRPNIGKKQLKKINFIFFLVIHFYIFLLNYMIILPVFNKKLLNYIYIIYFFIIIGLFFILHFKDPGRVQTKRYLSFIDIINKEEDINQFCPQCKIKISNIHTKHCLICNDCFEGFDHHCFWVDNCIGKKNFALFFVFLCCINLNTIFNFILATISKINKLIIL